MGQSSETKKLLSDQLLSFGPDFLKTCELCPDILASLQSPREVIQDTQILWAKVHKQKSYVGSNFEDDSDFLEIGELWSTYFDVFGKPYVRATSR